ncbi:hypothetical protein PAXRUDRAFT_502825 [Paxillus rubicundulus Ve08.2h10]|uniref:Unplaced genomic scaffold scaffold_347, whole genome shotgun sequence n=1 Tax=Paxillus rubicundulus Ve08.2h10 TaxID=930991 RepID=A0A0D0DNZ0_9AGAM|nr:hypothetical protein PAXRUDRAFT_502825 [Paxillus rubicundulus Ve08.2h10]
MLQRLDFSFKDNCSEHDHRLGHFRIVYYRSAAVFVATFACVAFAIPESFPKRRREEPRRLEREQRDDGPAAIARGSGSSFAFLVVLEPFKSRAEAQIG